MMKSDKNKPRLPMEWLTVRIDFPNLGHFYQHSSNWVSRSMAIRYVWRNARRKFKESRDTERVIITIQRAEKPLDAPNEEKYHVLVIG